MPYNNYNKNGDNSFEQCDGYQVITSLTCRAGGKSKNGGGDRYTPAVVQIISDENAWAWVLTVFT